MTPLTLTVVLPNFNHARHLPGALDALLHQTRPADEIIVIDDASTDDSVAVIERCTAAHHNLRLIRNERNRGVVYNMNLGMGEAKGDVVFFCAADDVPYRDLLRTGMDLLVAHPIAALFSARSDIIDQSGARVGTLQTPIPLATSGYVDPQQAERCLLGDDGWFTGNTSLYRRQALADAGGFPDDLQAFTDGYVGRLLALRHGACFSTDILGAWRVGERGMAWSLASDLENAIAVGNVAARRMRDAGLFSARYIERWRRRYLFGVRRFPLSQARQHAARLGTLPYLLALVKELLLGSWLFLTLRPWDLISVARKRIAALRLRNQ